MSDKLRIRLALDTTRAEKPVLNVLTGEGPVVMHGADLRVEVILLDGAHGDDDTDVLTITDLASLTVAIMDSSREGAPLASRRTTAFTACTLEDFDDGEPDHCHAAIEFDYTDTQILESPDKKLECWLVVYGSLGGGRDVFGTGPITVFRPGIPDDDATDLLGGVGRIHEGGPQLTADDGWHALAVQDVDGLETLVLDQAAFSGTFSAAGVGAEWGTNDGQLYHKTGTDWRPVEMFLQDGVRLLVLGNTTTTTAPNGLLTGTNYRLRSGRHAARDATSGYWHPLELAFIDGVYVPRWSETPYTT